MTQTITVYEYGLGDTVISIGDVFSSQNRTITQKDIKRLEVFAKQFGFSPFKFVDASRIVAQQFIGVIQLGENAIEILPKIDGLSSQGVRRNLISMLAAVHKLEIREVDVSKLATQNLSLLEIVIRIYCDKFFDQLRIGRIRSYERQEANLKLVRGKVISSVNAKLNLGYPERLFCEYDEFQVDNPLNRVFKATFRHLLKFTKDLENQKKLLELTFAFDEVADFAISNLEWHKIFLNRQSRRFELLYGLSKLFLKRKSTDVTSGGEAGYSLLFDMNELFEEFIGVQCRAVFKSCKVNLQGPMKYLLKDMQSGRSTFMTKPDITIEDGMGRLCIFDTKWKVLDSGKDKSGVLQQDIYQMFAYAHNYSCREVFLLYPHHKGLARQPGIYQRFDVLSMTDTKISIATICIENLDAVRTQLAALYSNIFLDEADVA